MPEPLTVQLGTVLERDGFLFLRYLRLPTTSLSSGTVTSVIGHSCGSPADR